MAAEFARETRTTRTHLERLPEDRLDWRPHAKSYTARDLASHIVDCVGWAERIMIAPAFDFDPSTYHIFRATSVADLLNAFDTVVDRGARALADDRNGNLSEMWSFKVRGRVWFEKTKADVLRDFTLSHLIHHRGQLTVYLRLLDVPVPCSYGPTADEKG